MIINIFIPIGFLISKKNNRLKKLLNDLLSFLLHLYNCKIYRPNSYIRMLISFYRKMCGVLVIYLNCSVLIYTRLSLPADKIIVLGNRKKTYHFSLFYCLLKCK